MQGSLRRRAPARCFSKLLRALEGKQIYRLGSGKPVPLDVRVLAATNQNLEAALEEKRFRRDLYYRLNVVRIELPPLRDRVEDIPTLLAHFVAPLNRTFGMAVNGFTRAASDTLLNYPWPGNVRELKNMLEAVFVNLPERAHGLIDLPQPVLQMLTRLASAAADERQRILRVLVATNWNKTRAARQLAWSRMTLYRKMARYHVVAGRPEIA
jgi:DNA-binding NtrC family response regulator